MEQVSDLSLFNELFTIYKGRFVRFAQTFTRDATIAEDIVIDPLFTIGNIEPNLIKSLIYLHMCLRLSNINV